MDDLMKLVIGWTFVGAFVFTVITTCLSLVGWVKFADRKQQQRLFQVVIIELVVGAAAQVAGVARFNPAPVKNDLRQAGANEATTETLKELLAPEADGSSRITKKQAAALVDRIKPRLGTDLAAQKEALRAKVTSMPEGTLSARDASEIRTHPLLKLKAATLAPR
jgi:hypothetical protein